MLRSWPGAVLVFLAALVYFLLFHRYGLFLQDEGVIAYQALRVSQGQVPYGDFQTAYTPAGYYLHALLFDAAGPSLVVLRVSASVACALTAALLFVAASQVLRSPYSVLPALLYVLLEDQESKGLVVHTIAYPARYISTLWALSLCVTLAHARRPRQMLPYALGLITAAIMSFKHTAGIYNAWAVGLSLIFIGVGSTGTATRGGTDAAEAAPTARGLHVLAPAFLLATLASLPVLFAGIASADRKALAGLCLPLAAAVLLLLRPASPWPAGVDANERTLRRDAMAATGADLIRFGLAALLPTALWVLYFGSHVGFDVLAQRLLLDGPAVSQSYAIPFPPLGTFASGVLGVVLVAVGARTLTGRGLMSQRAAARACAVSTGTFALACFVWIARLPWPVLTWNDWLLPITHVGRQLDNLGFYLAVVVSWAFLPRLLAWRRLSAHSDLVLVCWLHGICQFLLAYPRLDVAHLYEGVITLLLVGTVVLERTVTFVRRADVPARARWVPVAVASALAIVAVAKLAPRVAAQVEWRDGPRLVHRTGLAGPRGGLYGTERIDAGWFATLNRTIVFITEHTRPETPIFSFPALPGIYFLSGRDNPSPMDYFHHGFGQGSDELEVITSLEQAQAPMVVAMTDYSFDPKHLGYYPMLKDYMRRHFIQQAYFPPFRVFERVRP